MKATHTFAFCALLLTASAASAQTVESLATIENQYVAAFQLHVEQSHLAKVADLDGKYLQALDKAFKAATEGGQLKEAVALRDEMERVKGKQLLPEKDEGVESSLLKLRTTYRGQLAKLMADRANAAAPIAKKFDEALVTFLRPRCLCRRWYAIRASRTSKSGRIPSITS